MMAQIEVLACNSDNDDVIETARNHDERSWRHHAERCGSTTWNNILSLTLHYITIKIYYCRAYKLQQWPQTITDFQLSLVDKTVCYLKPRLHLIHVARTQVVSTCIRIQVARPWYLYTIRCKHGINVAAWLDCIQTSSPTRDLSV